MIETSAIIRQAYVPQKPARSKGIAKTKCRGPRVSKGGSEARILLLAWITALPHGRASALSTVPTVPPDLYRRLASPSVAQKLKEAMPPSLPRPRDDGIRLKKRCEFEINQFHLLRELHFK